MLQVLRPACMWPPIAPADTSECHLSFITYFTRSRDLPSRKVLTQDHSY